MAIMDRIIETLGGVTQTRLAELEQRFNEATGRAYLEGYFDGNDDPASSDLKAGGYGYRQPAQQLRDFANTSYDKIIESVWAVYQSNPVAKRALQLQVSYVLGGGPEFQIQDDDLRAIVDEFWRVNKLAQRLRQFVKQLGLWGEQIFPVFVRRSDGLVRLGYIDPKEVETVKTHPDNTMEPWAVCLKEAGSKRRIYRVIRQQEPVVNGNAVTEPEYIGRYVTADQAELEPWEKNWLAGYGLTEYSGSCFLFQVNNVSNQSRGFSDLLQVLDWLDQHDATLFEIADKEQFAAYFSWDVEVTGMSKDEIRARAVELRGQPPKKGSVNVHNEREKWSMNKPDLKQTESTTAARALLLQILGGLGYPEHWFGSGDAANRATAAEQNDPTWRTLEERQDYVKEMLITMLEFQRDQAVIAGAWQPKETTGDDGKTAVTAEESEEIAATLPEMTSKDVSRLAQAVTQLTAALIQAEQQGYVSHDTAAEIWAKIVAEFGVEVNVAAELEAVEEDEEPEESPMAGMVDQPQVLQLANTNPMVTGNGNANAQTTIQDGA